MARRALTCFTYFVVVAQLLVLAFFGFSGTLRSKFQHSGTLHISGRHTSRDSSVAIPRSQAQEDSVGNVVAAADIPFESHANHYDDTKHDNGSVTPSEATLKAESDTQGPPSHVTSNSSKRPTQEDVGYFNQDTVDDASDDESGPATEASGAWTAKSQVKEVVDTHVPSEYNAVFDEDYGTTGNEGDIHINISTMGPQGEGTEVAHEFTPHASVTDLHAANAIEALGDDQPFDVDEVTLQEDDIQAKAEGQSETNGTHSTFFADANDVKSTDEIDEEHDAAPAHEIEPVGHAPSVPVEEIAKEDMSSATVNALATSSLGHEEGIEKDDDMRMDTFHLENDELPDSEEGDGTSNQTVRNFGNSGEIIAAFGKGHQSELDAEEKPAAASDYGMHEAVHQTSPASGVDGEEISADGSLTGGKSQNATDAALIREKDYAETNEEHIASSISDDKPSVPKMKPKKYKCKEDRPMIVKLSEGYNGSFVMAAAKFGPGSKVKIPKIIPASAKADISDPCEKLRLRPIGEIIEELIIKKVVPEVDPLRTVAKGKRYNSCAVVGNGGGTLLAEYGKHIDAHTAVFRFNGGPTIGFERHVGKRTTFRLANTEHLLFHEPRTKELVLQHVTSSKTLNIIKKLALKPENDTLVSKYTNETVNVHAISPTFHKFVMNMQNKGAPSNGFYGIVLAHFLCMRITLFGYEKDWRNENIPYHYYNDIEPNESQFGRDTKENKPFNRFIEAVNSLAQSDPEWLRWSKRKKWKHEKVMFGRELYYKHSVKPPLPPPPPPIVYNATEDESLLPENQDLVSA